MDNARTGLELDEGTLDRAVEKGGVGVDRNNHWLKFRTLAGKVVIDLLFACAFDKACSLNGKEFSEDLTGCFVGRSIDELKSLGYDTVEQAPRLGGYGL